MSWRLIWSSRAAGELRRLDKVTAQRIGLAVTRFAETEQGDVKRLRGPERVWRLRVGDWWVKLVLDYASRTMTILRVLPRGRAYRD